MRLDEAVMTRGRLATLQMLAVSGAGLNSLIPMAVSPALPAMALHFGGGSHGEQAAKLVMATPALATAIVSLFVGAIAQRLGYRLCLLAALVIFVIAGAAGLLVSDVTPLIASRAAIGIAGAFIGTITIALTGLFEPHVRDRLIGFVSAMGGGTSIVALSAGGWMVDAGGWQAPFALYLAGIPAFFAALYAVRLQRAGPAVSTAAPTGGLPWRRLAPVYGLMLVLSVAFFTPGIQGPFLLTTRGVESAATQGMLLSIFAGTSAITAFAFGFIRPYLGERWIKALMLLSLGAGLAGMAAGTSLPQMAVALFLAGLGAGFATPQITSMVLERTPAHLHAHAIGGMYAAIFLGQFLNPILLDPLRAAFGLAGMFSTLGLALIAAGCLIGLIAPNKAVQATT